MARRRRRQRGTWFPNLGSSLATDVTVSGRGFVLTLAANDIVTAITPVTMDTPFEGDVIAAGVDSLADIVGSEYVLERIVGKLFASRVSLVGPIDTNDNNPAVLFGAGFFVARANDASSGGGEDTPIGSATAIERRDNYSALELDTVREPWIWRRTWILGNAGTAAREAAAGQAFAGDTTAISYPASTALYGSVADGPHIDSRVKRIVSNDNRLWLALSATPFPLNSEPIAPPLLVTGYIDYRLFARLRKARNQSSF